MQLSQKQQKIFQIFLLQFGSLNSILKILTKKMTFITDVVLILRTVKNVVR